MKKLSFVLAGVFASIVFGLATTHSAVALELDWSGQFWSEVNFIQNYTMDSRDGSSTFNATRAGGNGYYVPASGQKSANFQSLFLRLKPKLVVNDNVYIKSEWWVGDPAYGYFGSASATSLDKRNLNSTFTRGASITAQRFWGEFLTDLGTLQVGRAPLHYGLGLVWNSGDKVFDRYASTGDMIRLVSKFGAFSFSSAFVSYSMGNTLGGAGYNTGTPGTYDRTVGTGGGMTDYSIMLKYDNTEEDFEAGVNFIRRLAGTAQDPSNSYNGPSGTAVGMNYNIWDLFGRRKLGRWTFGAEAPITSGAVGGTEYSTIALAGEVGFKFNDSWELQAKAGQAPGQAVAGTETPEKWTVFYFHPNYKLGMVMFNYQLANFAGINTLNSPNYSEANLQSPYDNPIANARYLGLTGKYMTGKWNFHGDFVFAKAPKTATSSKYFYNTWSRQMVEKDPAAAQQGDSLGWEIDAGAALQWDDNFRLALDTGFYFPGSFYKFSNTATQNATDMVIATVMSIGVSF